MGWVLFVPGMVPIYPLGILRIIFPGLVYSVSGFGFLFLDLGFWFPAVFFVPLPVLFLPAVSSLLQAIRLGGEIS